MNNGAALGISKESGVVSRNAMARPHQRICCVHCGKTRRRPGGIYCCCLPNEEMIRRNKNPYRCPQCHLAYTE